MEVWTGGCTLLTGGWWIVIVDNNKKNMKGQSARGITISISLKQPFT